MPQFEMPFASHADQVEFRKLDTFTQGYVEAIFFTECTSDNPELEACNYEDLAPETLARIIADCVDFQSDEATQEDIADDEHRAGVDFWLTRNHHGAGFWDRGDDMYRGHGKALTERSHGYGGRDLYLGDDGKLYLA